VWKFISKVHLDYEKITIKLDGEEIKKTFEEGPVVLSYENESRIRFDFGVMGKNEFIKKAVGESEGPIVHTVKDVPVELVLERDNEILEIKFTGTVIVYDRGEGRDEDFLVDMFSEGKIGFKHNNIDLTTKTHGTWTFGEHLNSYGYYGWKIANLVKEHADRGHAVDKIVILANSRVLNHIFSGADNEAAMESFAYLYHGEHGKTKIPIEPDDTVPDIDIVIED